MSPLERRPLDESTSMCWAHLVVYLEERQTPLVASGACSDRGSFISHTEHLLRARNREVTPPALLQIGNSGRWTPWALLRFGREPAPPAYPTPSTRTAAVWASGAEVRGCPGCSWSRDILMSLEPPSQARPLEAVSGFHSGLTPSRSLSFVNLCTWASALAAAEAPWLPEVVNFRVCRQPSRG